MGFWIIPGAIFLGVMFLVIGVGVLMRERRTTQMIEDRLETFAGLKAAEAELPSLLREPIELDPGPGLRARIGSPSAWLQRLITQADLSYGATPFLLVSGALGVVGCLAARAAHLPAPAIPLGLGVGVLPLFYLFMRRRGRFKKFSMQLPDGLELMARAMRAGHSLAAGFQLVSQEMPAPIGVEFQRTYEEQNLGVPLEEALGNLGDRIPNLDLQFFVTAVSIQRQTGGDLAEILDKLGYVIRERFKLFGQVAALTAEGRLSGWILNGLPIALFLALLKLNPSYVMLLFSDPMGRKMLMVTGVLQVIGAIAIQKIVNIKV